MELCRKYEQDEGKKIKLQAMHEALHKLLDVTFQHGTHEVMDVARAHILERG